MFWDERVTYNGIRGYRYSIRDNFLNDMPDCFCINKIKDALVDDNGCLYPGALDLTECLGEKQKTSMRGQKMTKFTFRRACGGNDATFLRCR